MKFEFLLQNLQLKDNIMTIAPPPFPLNEKKETIPFRCHNLLSANGWEYARSLEILRLVLLNPRGKESVGKTSEEQTGPFTYTSRGEKSV